MEWLILIELADLIWFGTLATPVVLTAAVLGYGDDDDDGAGGFHNVE